MAFNDRIKEARLNKGLTQEQLADKIGVAKSTVTGYEKGNSEPSMLTVQKIMKELEIDANYLWQDEMSNTTKQVITLEEQDYIKKFRSLDEIDKTAINELLNTLYKRSILPKQFIQLERFPSIPYYGKVASAGTGQYIFDDIPPEMIEVNNQEANFAIGVNGNSMEPTYFDGDTVLIKKQSNINIGEIGIFMIDGEAFVKELGNGVLISHNKKYDDIRMTDDTVCIGKVLGKL